MKTIEIKCDGCGSDLTYTGNMVDYRLALVNESMASRGGFVTAMGIYPAIEREHHFCGLGCLDHWRDRERHRINLARALDDKWKDEHGHKDGDGRVVSWPSPPRETQIANAAECEAAALVAFPMARPKRS